MHRLVNSAVFSCAFALMVGCASDSYDGSIFVREAVAPGTGCTVTAQPGEPGVSHGELSSRTPLAYVITVQMQSRVTATTGEQTQRTILLTGANVDLEFPGSTLFTTAELADMKTAGITHFKSLFSAPLAPNDGITDAAFQLTTPALFDKIYAKAPEARGGMMPFSLEVLATFTVIGNLAGAEVTSQPFQFPVAIANTNGVLVNAGTCPLASGTILLQGNGCKLAQDAPVTCCEDASKQLICPAPVANAVAP